MGWLYSQQWNSAAAMRQHLREQLQHSGNVVVKDAATSFGRHYFAAVKTAKDGLTSLFVALINGNKYTGFGYKDMDEGMGPVDADCPVSLIQLLSPVEAIYGDSQAAKWAAEYRERCIAHAKSEAEKRTNAKSLEVGDKVWFTRTKNNPYIVATVGKNFKGTFRVLGYDVNGVGPYRLPLTRLERIEKGAK